ncbi:hypothetical protein BpHYR1_050918, partial [Brachionus plicatilis]
SCRIGALPNWLQGTVLICYILPNFTIHVADQHCKSNEIFYHFVLSFCTEFYKAYKIEKIQKHN